MRLRYSTAAGNHPDPLSAGVLPSLTWALPAISTIAIASLLVAGSTASAHHAAVEYADGDLMEISGVLARIMWRQPHVALFVEVDSEPGGAQEWRVENNFDPPRLANAGITEDLFTVGEEIAVYGRKSVLRDSILAENVLTEGGTEVVFPLYGEVADQRWSGSNLVGSANTFAEPEPVDAQADDVGFFRRWRTGRSPMASLPDLDLTDEAVASRDEWNELDNPIMRCEPQGLPEPIMHPGSLVIQQEGGNIILSHSWLNTRRIVYMDPDMSAENQESSRLGFSQGSWQDERTLAVKTTKIDWPYFFRMQQGDSIELMEVYRLSEDQSRLDAELTIVDPFLFEEGTATVNWFFNARAAGQGDPGECIVF